MQVEGYLEVLVVYFLEQSRGVGYEIGVPRPSSPATYTCRLAVAIAVPVPVHVEYHDIGRNIVIGKVFHYLTVVVGRVRFILAIPISEHIGRRQWYLTGYLREVAYSLFIVRTVAHKICIHSIRIGAFSPPVETDLVVWRKRERAASVRTCFSPGVIYHRPSRA